MDWFGAHGLHIGSEHAGGLLPLGREFILTQDDQIVPMSGHSTGSTGASTGGGTSGGGGPPASTLVGSGAGLQINLLWDNSVQNSANWSAIESAVVKAAKIYTNAFSNHTTLQIEVGYGEVGGGKMDAGALGESESGGYLFSYGQIANALASHDAGLVQDGFMAPDALSAFQNVSASFFTPSAEAKALGLKGPDGVDGYIGLSKSAAMFFQASGGTIGATQYDAVGVAAHELSEVMGRVGVVGSSQTVSRVPVYAPLDIFRYSAPHVLDLTGTASHFSLTDGQISLGNYNDPANGADASDWARTGTKDRDAYDAFDNKGVMTRVTKDDLLEVAALGYTTDPGFILKTRQA